MALTHRSSHRRCFIKRLFLRILQCSHESTCLGVSFNKAAGLKTSNFIKKRLQHRCFPVSIAKFLRTTVLKSSCERLLLKLQLAIGYNSTKINPAWNLKFHYPADNYIFVLFAVTFRFRSLAGSEIRP